MDKLNIGWVGLGNMGNAMAANLLKAGHHVTVFNRTRDKEKELVKAGARSAADLKDLVDRSDVIFTMLSDDKAVKAVYAEFNDFLSDKDTRKLLIDMSTVSPDTSRYLADLCIKQKHDFLDAPVSGSVKPAQDGTLIILVGGEAANYEKAKPLFDVVFAFGRFRCRKLGKACHQLFPGHQCSGVGRNRSFRREKWHQQTRYVDHYK
jgi:3-hydroxyisobutyrate dehydrogenase